VSFAKDFALQLCPRPNSDGRRRRRKSGPISPLFQWGNKFCVNLGKNKVACCVKL
jgi:hypothetical protein